MTPVRPTASWNFLGLLQAVLAGDGVQHQPDLLGLLRVGLGDGPLDLLQLLHEVVLGVEAACGVHEEEVVARAFMAWTAS
jgi:hypothetical protein